MRTCMTQTDMQTSSYLSPLLLDVIFLFLSFPSFSFTGTAGKAFLGAVL